MWLPNDIFVGPGVTIGRGCVVGARSTVLRDLPEMMLCAGYPAKPIRPRLAPRDDIREASHPEQVCALQD